MKTLIIYDGTGYIIAAQSGDYRIPVGVPYIETDIPAGKYVASVNMETGEPIMADYPKSEYDIKMEQMSTRIADLEATQNVILGVN